MSRRDRYAETDISVERYEDRRERDYVSRGGRGRGGGERYYEEEIEYRSRPAPHRERERERVVIVKEREEFPHRDVPEFLREDYGRTSAGPLVLRERETEDFEYAPKPRRRSPSPEPEPKVSREEIIIRKHSPSPERPPLRREREVYRDETIIRKHSPSPERSPPRREREVDREEIIIRRDERSRDRRPPPPHSVYTTIKRYRIGEDDSRPSVDRRFHVNRLGERVEETRIVRREFEELRGRDLEPRRDEQEPDIVASDKDITVHLDLDIQIDISEDIEVLAHLNRLGRFKEAIQLFEEKLQDHLDFFPVVAEYADLLLEQGSYGRLSEFLSERLNEQEDGSVAKFAPDEELLLKSLKALAEVYSKGALRPALSEALHALKYFEDLKWTNRLWSNSPSGIQVRPISGNFSFLKIA
jgi:hypothetical protein